MVFSYVAYGMNIRSDIEIPEFIVGDFEVADVHIRLEVIDVPTPADFHFDFSPTTQTLIWTAVGKFQIRGTSEIVVDRRADVPDAITRLPLVGSVMALLLSLRGMLVLHASAVCVDGHSVGFMGDKGAGKSTTAGILVSHGYPLITDDVLPLTFGPEIEVVPGFPQMKLTDQSAAVVNLNNTKLMHRATFPGFDKRQYSLSEDFLNVSTQPRRLYVLARGEKTSIESCDVASSFQAIVRYSYLRRFGKTALFPANAKTFMEQCGRLSRLGIVRRLTVPQSLERLADFIDIMKNDVNE